MTRHAGTLTVCDITQAWHASSGGIRTYLDAKRRLLDEAGARHVLVVPGTRDATERDGRHVTHYVASPPIPGCTPYRAFVRPRRLESIQRAERPDVVEYGDPFVAAWAALAYRRAQPDAAVVGFYHTDLPRAYVEAALAPRLGRRAARAGRRLATRYVLRLYGRNDLTVTASPDLTRRLARIGVPNVLCRPLGVDTHLFRPERRRDAVRRVMGAESARDPLLVYAGRFDHEKRILVLVEAFRRLPEGLNATLALAGEGPLRATLLEIAERTPRLHVLPYQASRPALADLLAASDLYVTAAPFETFGLSVLEAQACGLPVVGVAAGAMIDRVPRSLGLLVPPDDPGALAAGIVTVACADRTAMGRAARDLVERRYAWRQALTALLGAYADTLDHRRGRTRRAA